MTDLLSSTRATRPGAYRAVPMLTVGSPHGNRYYAASTAAKAAINPSTA